MEQELRFKIFKATGIIEQFTFYSNNLIIYKLHFTYNSSNYNSLAKRYLSKAILTANY